MDDTTPWTVTMRISLSALSSATAALQRRAAPVVLSLAAVACGAEESGKSGGLPTDADGDGYFAEDDCDDNDASVNPSAPEYCDGVDNDCDELVDVEDPDIQSEDVAQGWADSDEDGYGDPDRPTNYCTGTRPSNVSTNSDDCDDRDDETNPDGNEVCDGIDNDCDNLVDADDVDAIAIPAFAPDDDGDGYGDSTRSVKSCEDPGGDFVEDDTDCNDADPDISPGAEEVCGDGIDSDCDGFDRPPQLSGDAALECGVVEWAFGAETIRSGDIDGDGMVELALGSSVEGVALALDPQADALTALTDVPEGESFGAAVAMGDVDGDGVAELFVGSPGGAGAVHRFAGPITGGLAVGDGVELDASSADMIFGAALALAPDLGGDGQPDLLIGAPGTSGGVGGVAMLSDASDFDSVGMLQLGRGFPAGAGVGAVVEPVGDLDGDGVEEIGVGIPGQGAVAIVIGGVTDFTANDVAVLQVETPGSEFGRSIAGGADLDGDGLSDLVVGAPRVPESGGSIFVFVSPTDGMTEGDAYSRIDGPENGAEVGTSLAMVGDINGDSYVDFTVGAPGFDDGAGRLEVVFGPVPNGVPATTDNVAYHLYGTTPGDLAGYATHGPGDLDGDGYFDFIGSAVGDGSTWLFMGAPLP